MAAAAALSGLGAPAASAQAAIPAGPPIVSQNFTLLPCSSTNTTVGLEGCAEHRLIRLDAQINSLSRQIYYTLKGIAPRQAFVTAAHGWDKSRRAGCLRESARYGGGTLRPVAFVDCESTRDRARIGYLTHRLRQLRVVSRRWAETLD